MDPTRERHDLPTAWEEEDTKSLSLSEWAFKYRGSAVVGLLALLLVLGRSCHRQLSHPKVGLGWLGLGMPHALLGGLLGLLAVVVTEVAVSPDFVEMLRVGLHEMVSNLINFAFAAHTLGFAAGTSLGGAAPDLLTSWRKLGACLWHEGIPMLLYSQVLLWGSSCVALTICGFWRFVGSASGGAPLSPFAGAVINLGLEAGRDVLPAQVRGDAHAEATVHLADMAGLFFSLLVGVTLLVVLLEDHDPRQAFPASGGAAGSACGPSWSVWCARLRAYLRHLLFGPADRIAAHSARPRGGGPARQRSEHFQRGGSVELASGSTPSSPRRTAEPELQDRGGVGSGGGGGGGSSMSMAGSAGADEVVSLGSHVAMVALSVFFAYSIMLLLKTAESTSPFLQRHSLLSNIRLFKLSMLVALVLLRHTHKTLTSLHAGWFYRTSGLCLDLLTIAAIASIEWSAPASKLSLGGGRGASLRGSFELTVLGCVVWNLWALRVLAPDMFPNYHFARATVLIGDCLGHSWVGLLLCRAYDPDLSTPVPLAFTAKMLLSLLIPESAGKNQLVISLIEAAGLFPALCLCGAVLTFWLCVHTRYFKPLWPKQRGRRSSKSKTDQHEGEEFSDSDELDEETAASQSLLGTSSGGASVHGGSSSNSGVGSTEGGVEETKSGVCGAIAGGAGCSPLGLVSGMGHTVGLPPLSEPSQILSSRMLRAIQRSLPPALEERLWHLSYALSRDGASLATMVRAGAGAGNYVLVVEDSWGYVFGAFLSQPLTTRNGSRYFGTGETWLFSFHNLSPEDLAVYRWTRANELFVLCNERQLAIGGGGGFGLQLDDELDNGVSDPCATFGNKRLSSSAFFKTLNVELFSLRSSRDAMPPALGHASVLEFDGTGDV